MNERENDALSVVVTHYPQMTLEQMAAMNALCLAMYTQTLPQPRKRPVLRVIQGGKL